MVKYSFILSLDKDHAGVWLILILSLDKDCAGVWLILILSLDKDCAGVWLNIHSLPGQKSCWGMVKHSFSPWTRIAGAGCSSVDSVPAFEAVGRRIDPSQWTQLQFGLFSVPTSGPQLVYQRP